MQHIDRHARIPIYHQIAMQLEQRIASGEFPLDSQIPSERDLASAFGTSRTTMRQALSTLEESGILERRRPNGTFVREKPEKLSPTLSIPVSFVRSLVTSGHEVAIEPLSTMTGPTHDATVLSALRIEATTHVTIIERLIRSESLPIALVESMVPNSRFPNIGNQPIIDNSIHRTLLLNYGSLVSEADHSIECAFSTPRIADRLKVEVKSPILKLESCYYDQHHQPVEFVYTYWRADVMKLRMKTSLVPSNRGDLAD